MLWIAVALIAVSLLLLRRNGSEGVQLGWPPIELPQLCASRVYFGVECPGCGVTRSILALKDGEFRSSWQLHRLGWLIALAVVGQIPYRLYSLNRSDRNVVVSTWATWFGYILTIALILNWLLKISGV